MPGVVVEEVETQKAIEMHIPRPSSVITPGSGGNVRRPLVFLSHNWRDKSFAKRLAEDLEKYGARVWFDTEQIRVGESIISKIAEGVQDCNFLVVILSPNSVGSSWVQTELRLAMTQELNLGQVKVLPLLYQDCQMPSFLSDKLYADFRAEQRYREALERLLTALGLSFDGAGMEKDGDQASLYKSFPIGFYLYCLHHLILAALPFGLVAGKLMPGESFNYAVGGVGWVLGMALLNYFFWRSVYGLIAILVLGPSFILIIYLLARPNYDLLSIGGLVLGYLAGCVWLFAAFLMALHAPDVVVRKSGIVYNILATIDAEPKEKSKEAVA
ncbi:MAG TPA: toll/interleukin-1 receptor domain-containing protein [Thermoanaerobaculia bacterium]|nr:toll/interleukin-1 receptor domain-containing protein [Thermoanaerobaculia bacterium]